MSRENNNISPIFREQIKECCRRHYEIFVSALLAITFVFYLSYDQGNDHVLITWVGVTGSVLLLRFLYVQHFNRLADSQIQVNHAHVFVFIMFIWGVSWCVATVLFFPKLSMPQQAAWFAMFMVMVAASATSHSVYLRAFYAFALPYFVGMLWMVTTEYPSPFHLNAIVVTLVMITQVGAAKKGNKAMLESLRLRFHNLDLIEKLKQQKEHAENANQAKSKFLAAASHDLRQPLHALTLFSSALQDSLEDKQKSFELAEQINASVDTLQQLFNVLLDISRLDAGTLVCEKEHFSSKQLFHTLKNDFTPLAIDKGLRLEWDCPDVILYSDPTLLQLIIRNLISNALNYTHTGGIKVVLRELHEQVCIDIIDTGIGIPSTEQTRVFDEFVQLHNPERDRNKGLGLGLSIVKRVGNLIDSELTLQSKINEGSIFSVSVKKGERHKVASQVVEKPMTEATDSAHILVIDDEVAILNATTALLQSWGYNILVAGDIAQAKSILKHHNVKPNCIIADFRLRENVTGLDAVQAIRELYKENIPALIVSGDIAPECLKLIKSSGLDILHKPVQPARLRSFLQNKIR